MRVVDGLFLAIGLVGLVLAYLGVARATGWWPFKRRRRPRSAAPPDLARPDPAPGPGSAHARLGLAIGAAGLVLAYLSLANAAGWWPFEEPTKGPVRIDTSASMFNPQDGETAAREYVCLVNKTNESVDLQGWELQDESHGTVNVLREFRLPAKGHVKVHPGRGRDSPTDVFGNRRGPVWTDSGDTVTLLDRDGRKVDSRRYHRRPKDDATAPCS